MDYLDFISAISERGQIKTFLVKRLEAKRAALTDEECQGLVLAIFKDGLTAELERYVTAHRQQIIVAVENWWDKYRVTLQDIEAQRDAARQQLSEFLSGLGYAQTDAVYNAD